MRLILVRMLAVCWLLLCSFSTTTAEDWPQWMGPQRDGIWREEGIVDRFPTNGLTVRWRVPVALGYSGPAVANGKVYLTDFVHEAGTLANSPDARNRLRGMERVLCLDAQTGELIWKEEYAASYNLSYAAGPRATPTVHGGRVYTLGAHGDLLCLDAASGEPLWRKQLAKEYKVEVPIWGFCGHPLVDEERLFCLVGGVNSVAVAFDTRTGEEIWRALSASEPGYCPPTMIELDGRKQLLIWHTESINSLDPRSGQLYWSEPFQPAYGMAIAAPRLADRHLFASGVGNQSVLLRLAESSPAAEVVWRGTARRGVACSHSTPMIDQGVIYGVGGQKGELCAVQLETGKRLWESYAAISGKRASYGTVFIVKHQDRYFLFNDQGELILAHLSPSGYEELDRFRVLEPTNESFGRDVVWSHPAFANRCLYARNDKELVCVSLAKP